MGQDQNGCHFASYVLITISLKFVPKGSMDNTSELVQVAGVDELSETPLAPAMVPVMAWWQEAGKPLSEPMMTKICNVS